MPQGILRYCFFLSQFMPGNQILLLQPGPIRGLWVIVMSTSFYSFLRKSNWKHGRGWKVERGGGRGKGMGKGEHKGTGWLR